MVQHKIYLGSRLNSTSGMIYLFTTITHIWNASARHHCMGSEVNVNGTIGRSGSSGSRRLRWWWLWVVD